MKSKLFSEDISPACAYCAHGDFSKDRSVVLCEKRGIMEPHNACRAFSYAPLKRVPLKPKPLPSFDPNEFEL